MEDIDPDARTVTIRQTLTRDRNRRVIIGEREKTTSGSRRVPLSPSTILSLRRHLAHIRRDQLATVYWDDAGVLFPDAHDRVQHPDAVRSRYTQAIGRTGLPVITIHGLRYTNATLLLRAALATTVVSKRLEHKHVSMTLDVYAHVPEDMEDAATEHVETLFGATM